MLEGGSRERGGATAQLTGILRKHNARSCVFAQIASKLLQVGVRAVPEGEAKSKFYYRCSFQVVIPKRDKGATSNTQEKRRPGDGPRGARYQYPPLRPKWFASVTKTVAEHWTDKGEVE